MLGDRECQSPPIFNRRYIFFFANKAKEMGFVYWKKVGCFFVWGKLSGVVLFLFFQGEVGKSGRSGAPGPQGEAVSVLFIVFFKQLKS